MPTFVSTGGGGLSENVRGMSRPRVPKPTMPSGHLGMPGYGGGPYKPMKAPKSLFPRVGRAIKAAGKTTVKPIVSAAAVPKPPAVVSAAGAATGGAGAVGGSNDLNSLISSMLVSTNPADAQKLVDSIYAPQRQAVLDQIAQMQAGAQARASQMSQVYQAFAQYMGGLQGKMAAIYQSGNQDGAALTSGMAGPTGAVGAHLQAMSDAGLVGQESKIWQSWAAAQPGIYSLMATQNIKQMLNAEGANEATLRSKLLDLSSQEASSILSYLQDAQAKDIQIKQWGYGQITAQQTARSTAAYNALKLAQSQQAETDREAYIEYQEMMLGKKFTAQQAQQIIDNKYKAQKLADSEAVASATQAYRNTMAGIAQQTADASTSRAATAATNARTSAKKVAQAPAIAAAKTRAAAVKTAQGGVNRTLIGLGKDLATKRTKLGPASKGYVVNGKVYPNQVWMTSNGTVYNHQVWEGPKGQVSTTPVKGYAKVPPVKPTSGQSRIYSKQNLWDYAWKNYAPTLFSYYRTLYPKEAAVKGMIQKRVTRAIARAVGWQPPGTKS